MLGSIGILLCLLWLCCGAYRYAWWRYPDDYENEKDSIEHSFLGYIFALSIGPFSRFIFKYKGENND